VRRQTMPTWCNSVKSNSDLQIVPNKLSHWRGTPPSTSSASGCGYAQNAKVSITEQTPVSAASNMAVV